MQADSRQPRRRPAGNGTVVEVLEDLDELRSLIPDWESLAAQAAEPNPFYEHWMLLPALEAYGAGPELRCIAVWHEGTLSALFAMRSEDRFHGLPVRALTSWSHRNMLVTTPLVRARDAARCIAALLEAKLAPAIEFGWGCAGGPFYGALAETAVAQHYPWTISDAYTRAVLLRERDPRELLNSKMRSNVRRWRARLRRTGALTSVRLSPGDDIDAWLEEFLTLEASGWKGKAGTALRCREDDRRFVSNAFTEAFRRGRLLITGLDLDGRPLARFSVFTAGDGAYAFKTAYDESYASSSPGVLAELDSTEQFFASSGPRWMDAHMGRWNSSPTWKDRVTMQRVAIGVHGAGRPAVALLPLLRLAKHALARRKNTPAEGPARYSLSVGSAA